MEPEGPKIRLSDSLYRERAHLLAAVEKTTLPLWPDVGWGKGAILAHIPYMEAWLRSPLESLIAGQEGILENMDEAKRDQLWKARVGRPVEELIGWLHEEREKTRALLVGAKDEVLEKPVETQWGELTCAQVLKMIYRHDREHAAQLLAEPDV